MVSVIMATYNGAERIDRQLQSLVEQTRVPDEIIIGDDGSTDNTVNIVKEYQSRYSCIRLIQHEHLGVVRNFEVLLKEAIGDIVFFCDQDDVWMRNKIEIIAKRFSNASIGLVMHDEKCINENGKVIQESFAGRMYHGVIRNIIKSSYYGHRMAISKTFANKLLPFPKCILYDQYIGACAEYEKCALFIDDRLSEWIIHGHNFSKRRLSTTKRMSVRINNIKCLRYYVKRAK